MEVSPYTVYTKDYSVDQMKFPKKKQLYDVCELRQNGKITHHISTPHYNIPASMARFFTRNTIKKSMGIFLIYVKNGVNPLEHLKSKSL